MRRVIILYGGDSVESGISQQSAEGIMENIDQAKMLVEVDIKKRDVKEVVNEWLDNNPDKWKSWLPK